MSLTRTLYRDILKKAKNFDKYPVLKVRISPPLLEKVFEKKAEERQLLGTPSISNYFYTPHSFGGDSFYNTFRALFREGVNINSATGVSNAFSIIRDLNNTLAIAAKPKKEEHTLPKPSAIPSSALTKPSSPSSSSSPSSPLASALSSLSSSSSSISPNVEFIFMSPSGQKLDRKQVTFDEKSLLELEKGLSNMGIELVEEEGAEEEEGEGKKDKTGLDDGNNSKEDEEKQRKEVQEVVRKMLLEFEQKALAVKTATDSNKEKEKEETKETETENKTKANIWVKPSTVIQPGTVLITQPSHDYDSGRYLSCFYRSVVLICGTTPISTVGLILNKPLYPDEAKDKYKLFASAQSKEYRKLGLATMPVALEKANWFMGGPVDAKPPHAINLSNFGTFSALYSSSSPIVPDSKPLIDNIYCGGSIYKLMNAIENNEVDLKQTRLFMGCSIWSKGQLEEEINKGWWIQGDASSNYIFGSDPKAYETQWEDGLNLMGGEYPSFVQAAKLIGHPEPMSNIDDSRVPYCTLQMLNLK